MDEGRPTGADGARRVDVGSGAAHGTDRHADTRRRAVVHGREPLPTRVADVPSLPRTYDDALAQGLAELGVSLSSEARERIDGHVRLLLAWTTAINLTAIRDPAEIAVVHVVDSLAGLAPLRDRGIDRFVDLGSGGGFPGLPLAAALPAHAALLVDSVRKKAGFLRVAVAATGLTPTVTAVATRAEALAADPRQRGTWPAVTARAVAALPELVELAFPLLAPDGILLAWKRGDITAELDATGRATAALGGGTIEVREVDVEALAGHLLVVVTKRGPTSPSFPREPAIRRRRPW
jgi:16S rRNA (guanine527-N7)-methyltransferase